MPENCYKFFENKACKFYPCHNMDSINCLFCFCPLYLTENCGGCFQYITDKNGIKIKDCSNCCIPHMPDGYDYVINKIEGK